MHVNDIEIDSQVSIKLIHSGKKPIAFPINIYITNNKPKYLKNTETVK